jgi:hypothetical protein
MVITNARALRLAETHGLAGPRLIAADLDGRASGTVATLETFLSGSSDLPPMVSAARLREAGAASGRAAIAVPYWDAVAALNTPTVIHGEWLPGFAGDGSPLDAAAVTERRDAFLRTALDQLPTPSADRGVADTRTPSPRSPDPSARSLRAHRGTLAQASCFSHSTRTRLGWGKCRLWRSLRRRSLG